MMGESLQNQDPRLGSTRWADWTNQASNLALIASQLRLLIPVQEMLPFQRIVRDRQIQFGPTVGQFVTVEGIVPAGEAWRLLWVSLSQNDGGNHNVVLRISPRVSTFAPVTISRRVVPPNIEVPLYPSKAINAGSNVFFDPQTGPAFELFEGDSLVIFDQTAVVNAGPLTWVLTLRYELIPPPLELAIDDIFTGQTF